MKDAHFTWPDDLVDEMDQRAKQQGKSRNDLAIEYVKHGLVCKKLAEKTPKPETMKQIENQFPNKHCREPSCNKEIQVSERCWWGRDETGKSFLVCTECHDRININAQSDPELAKKDLISRNLDKRILVQKKFYNFLLDQNNQKVSEAGKPELEKITRQGVEEKIRAWQTFTTFLREHIGTQEQNESLKKLAQLFNEFDVIIQGLHQQRREMILKPKLTRNLKELLMEAEALPLGIVQTVKVGKNEGTGTEQFIKDPEAGRKAREPIPGGGLDSAGRTYCPFGGIRVFPLKCEKCKQDSYAQWDTCQKQKQKQDKSEG